MKVQCPKCNTSYRVPDERIPAGAATVRVRCKNCGTPIDVAVGGQAPEVSQAVRWFVAVGTERKGPLEQETVISMLRSGEIGPETYVWRKGFKEWLRLREVPELAEHVPGVARAMQPEVEEEPTVLTSVSVGEVAGSESPVAAQQPDAQSPEKAGKEPEEEVATKMIWQRRETSVLFSLEDYKSRRRTRATKPITVAPPSEVGAPATRVAESAEERKPAARPTVISLEEAEIRRVAEALGQRHRRRRIVRVSALGLFGLAVVAGATYLVIRYLYTPAPVIDAGREVAPKVAVQQEAKEPQPAKPPEQPITTPRVEEQPKQEKPVAEKEVVQKKKPEVAHTSGQKGKQPRVEQTAQRPQEQQPASKPEEPETQDVNKLLANLRTGQASGAKEEKKEGPTTERSEALPEQLTTAQIQSVLRRQQREVEQCVRNAGIAPGSPVTVNTRIEIEGSGRVVSATVTNAGAAEGCIRSVLMGLKFPGFRGPNMTVPYPFRVTP